MEALLCSRSCEMTLPRMATVSSHCPSSLWVVMASLLLPISGLPCRRLLCDRFCSLPASSPPAFHCVIPMLLAGFFFFHQLALYSPSLSSVAGGRTLWKLSQVTLETSPLPSKGCPSTISLSSSTQQGGLPGCLLSSAHPYLSLLAHHAVGMTVTRSVCLSPGKLLWRIFALLILCLPCDLLACFALLWFIF